MWLYLAIFACALASDSVPVVGLPAWTIMVLFWAKFDLNPWLVLAAGVPGSVLGRYIFSLYAPKLSDRWIKQRKNREIEFVGKKLDQNLWRSWLFVFIYSLTPLSTTALFAAAGIARVRPSHFVPPFFAGKFIVDAVMLFSGRYAVTSVSELLRGTVSWKGLAATIGGLLVVALLFFIDWRTMLEKRKFRLDFRILR